MAVMLLLAIDDTWLKFTWLEAYNTKYLTVTSLGTNIHITLQNNYPFAA